jgi:predicted acylesterase/phospholipase RssA/CRP-like cAMP-binding protein
MQTDSIYQLIRGIQFFDSLTDETLKKLSAQMSMRSLKGGEYLMKQGDPADCLYILAHGRLQVSVKTPKGQEARVGEIGVGDIVGEMALLTDLPRSATVRAVRDCRLVKIDRALFESIIKEHTQAAMGIVSECVKRLLPNFMEKKHRVKTICIVPCDKAVDIRSVAEHLSTALGKYVRIKLIRSDDPELKSRWQDDRSALYDWLRENEQAHDLVVYLADHDLNEFTELAISQSDKILRVTTPEAQLNESLVQYINQSSAVFAEKYLVIVHPASTKMPENTVAILKKITCAEHFHVKQAADYERLARYLLGRSIAVVFSGGGLRGIAHHGLITALYERGIPIDMASGTSFGALPALFAGLGITPDAMLDVWKAIIDKIKKVVDITLPMAALTKGEVLYELLSGVLPPAIYMEDLWIPTFCVSTNVANFSSVIHRTGPAWEAVRASMSIPGIFPPVIRGNEILVDGASMNNLPVDLMGTLNNQGTILASVASGKPNQTHYTGYTGGLSGWRMLLHTKDHIVPNIIETMLSASLSASTLHQERMVAAADYAFDLGVDGYKLLDAEHWEQIRATGYDNAVKLLDQYGLTLPKLVSD